MSCFATQLYLHTTRLGFEPRLSGSKPLVLPLHHRVKELFGFVLYLFRGLFVNKFWIIIHPDIYLIPCFLCRQTLKFHSGVDDRQASLRHYFYLELLETVSTGRFRPASYYDCLVPSGCQQIQEGVKERWVSRERPVEV